MSIRLLVNSSTSKKNFFYFVTLTPSLFRRNALFIGGSVVRVSVRASDLPSHLPSHPRTLTPSYPHTLVPSHPYSSGKKASCLLRILWMGVRFNSQGANKAAVYRQCSYVALLVQLCCHCWCNYAAPLVFLCSFVHKGIVLPQYSYRITPVLLIGLLQYLHWITPVLL